jgi:hypothetical protein
MKILTSLIMIGYAMAIAMAIFQVVRDADSIPHALEQLSAGVREALSRLMAWGYALAFAFSAGLIEGFLWQRQQIFAGFYRTVLMASIPTVMALVMTAVLFAVVPQVTMILGLLVGLSFCLGLTLLAGRPLVR